VRAQVLSVRQVSASAGATAARKLEIDSKQIASSDGSESHTAIDVETFAPSETKAFPGDGRYNGVGY